MAACIQRLGPHLLLHVPAAEVPVGGFLLGAPHALAEHDVVEGVGELGGVRFENVGVEEGGGRLGFLFFWFLGSVLDHCCGDECLVVGLGVA